MAKLLFFVERQNYAVVLFLPFLVSISTVIGLPTTPQKDEVFFLPLIIDFGQHYFPSISDIRQMTQPQGPFYFLVFGFVGEWFNYSLLALRLFNVLLGYAIALCLYKILARHTKLPSCLSLWFVLNPYFLLLTTPYIYTDNLCILCVLIGVYFFVEKQNRWLAGLAWGFALWTRQVAIIVPLAAILVDLYFNRHHLKQLLVALLQNTTSLVGLFLLFVIWEFNLTPPNNIHKMNTVGTFEFSLRQLNYSIVLLGLYSAPLWITKLPELWRSRLMVPAGVAAVSLIVSFPRLVNQDSAFYSVWTGGYFDKLLVFLGDFAYILVPLIWVPSLAYLFLCMLPPWPSRHNFFAISTVVLFLAFESIYTFVWDKYFILVIPFILLSKVVPDQPPFWNYVYSRNSGARRADHS